MGIEILSEELYRNLQKLGKFDTKPSSWIKTPPEIRKLGGAIFAHFGDKIGRSKTFVYTILLQHYLRGFSRSIGFE